MMSDQEFDALKARSGDPADDRGYLWFLAAVVCGLPLGIGVAIGVLIMVAFG